MKVKEDAFDQGHKGMYYFKCPCGLHENFIPTIPSEFSDCVWGFNGNVDNPTFTPSILVRTGKYVNPEMYTEGILCHSFVTDGKIQFLGDCSHELRGQTVELFEIAE